MATIDATDYKTANSIYEFTVKDTFGNDVPLEQYRGKVVLIVNIASQCGLTKSNYEKLTQLNDQYYDKGLRILAFPCNQFASQMPESNGEDMVCHLKKANANIGEVMAKVMPNLQIKWNRTIEFFSLFFSISHQVNVNGESAIPLYKYLRNKQNGFFGNAIKWNFTKFLCDKNGQPVDRFAPTTDPLDIGKEIDKLL